MSDRINMLCVVLDRDMRDDDVAPLADAIRQLRGVQSVTLNVADIMSHIAESRAREDLKSRLWDALKEPRA